MNEEAEGRDDHGRHEDERNPGDDDEIGERADDGELPEVKEHERGGRHGRGRCNEQGRDEGFGRVCDFGRQRELSDADFAEFGVEIGTPNNAQDGGKRELEADGEDDVGVGSGHGEGGEEKCAHFVAFSSRNLPEIACAEHDEGALRAERRADKEQIDGQDRHHEDKREAAAAATAHDIGKEGDDAAQDGDDEEGNDAEVHAAHGQDVRNAQSAEIVAGLIVDGARRAQDERREHAGAGVRLQNVVGGAPFGIEPCTEMNRWRAIDG